VSEPAHRDEERFGPLALAREHPEVNLVACPLRPSRHRNDQLLTFPANVIDAVSGRTGERSIATLRSRLGHVRWRPCVIHVGLDEEGRVPGRVHLQVHIGARGSSAVTGRREPVEIERAVVALDEVQVGPPGAEPSANAIGGEARVESVGEDVYRRIKWHDGHPIYAWDSGRRLSFPIAAAVVRTVRALREIGNRPVDVVVAAGVSPMVNGTTRMNSTRAAS
jgi:hypothetical protein